MKLAYFSLRNYRSILRADKLPIGNYTVFLGPNNEGKSNILKAIVLSLEVLGQGLIVRRVMGRISRAGSLYNRLDYDWFRDFPLLLQKDNPNGRSEFILEFGLTNIELSLFRKKIGVNLSTNLKIRLSVGQDGVRTDVIMPGLGKKKLNDKKNDIAVFVKDLILAQYISAIRPSEKASDIVDRIVSRALYSLESDKEYLDLLNQIRLKQQPILNAIAKDLKTTIRGFIPQLKDVKVENPRSRAVAMRSESKLLVDDGTLTELALKGDGFVSLAIIALMQYVSQSALQGQSLILSVEEPESHLHPNAIHGLRQVLKTIAANNQVIITTHSPILVERDSVRQNIVVADGKASRAKSIGEIRGALGIRLSDNLVGAHLMLLVEGEDDKDLLNVWLPELSPKIKDAMAKNMLCIDSLAGASNLAYKVTFYRNNLCGIQVYMDGDDPGRNSVNQAMQAHLIEPADYNLTSCHGMRESELEDLILPSAYNGMMLSEFGIDLLGAPEFKQKAKWSDRVRAVFSNNGKNWSSGFEAEIKQKVARQAAAAGVSSLNPHQAGSISNLVSNLERKLGAHT